MEFSLGSIVSSGNFLNHLFFLLLVLSMLSPKIYWLRVGIIAAALAGIAHALLETGDMTALSWLILLLAINLDSNRQDGGWLKEMLIFLSRRKKWSKRFLES